MNLIETLKREFPEATTPLEQQFAGLRNKTLDAIGQQQHQAARTALIECCDLCQTAATTQFDDTLEMLDFLCELIEIQTFGTPAQKKELTKQLKPMLAVMLSTEELAEECFQALNDGNLKKAKIIRAAMGEDATEITQTLDPIINACQAVKDRFKTHPKQTTAAVLEQEQTEAEQIGKTLH